MMNQSQYADHRGVTRQMIHKLVKKKTLPTDKDGKLDPAVCDEILKKIQDPARTLGNLLDNDDADDDRESYSDATIAHKRAQTQLIEIQLRERGGELVNKADVEREAFTNGRQVRDRLMRLPEEIGGKLVSLKDEKEIQAFLRTKIREALMEASHAISDSE